MEDTKQQNQSMHEGIALNQKSLRQDQSERQRQIKHRREVKDSHANEILEAIKFDHIQKREIMSLRKSDQTENYQRKIQFEKMVKHRLAEES